MATELSLIGKKDFPRKLWISVARQHVTVALYVDSQKKTRIVYAIAKISDCYLALDKYSPALWIGSTSFDVAEAEAQQIRATYEPIGLRIASAL